MTISGLQVHGNVFMRQVITCQQAYASWLASTPREARPRNQPEQLAMPFPNAESTSWCRGGTRWVKVNSCVCTYATRYTAQTC